MATMYVRVKRLKTTSFLHVEPTDTIGSVKAKLQDLLQQAPERQQLHKDGTLLEDDRTLADLKIETDDALTLVLQQDDGSWESPQVVHYDDDGGNEES